MSLRDFLINVVVAIPPLKNIVSRVITNRAAGAIHARPRPFSLWSHQDKPDSFSAAAEPVGEYTAWPMLVDERFSKRYLPPCSEAFIKQLPLDVAYKGPERMGDITRLFMRGDTQKDSRSSALFTFFAQWFTDSVLRIDPKDRRKNTSNHNIDLCQIYGLTEETARILRSGNKGKLSSQMINGEEFPDYLGEYDESGYWQVKPKYRALPYAKDEAMLDRLFADWSEEEKGKIYATGLERGNSSIGYIAVSTLFLREHNRLCDVLAADNPNWDDERLFQTARMINMVILMKLVIEDYINHIAGNKLFVFDPRYAEKQQWYRAPWIAVEFDLLYRWHGLIPDTVTIDGTAYGPNDYRGNNGLLEQAGLEAVLVGVSTTAAGAIGLHNSPKWMASAEYQMVKMGRDFRLQSYNQYRKAFKLKPLTHFSQLNATEDTTKRLELLYGDIDTLEFTVGLFAEGAQPGRLFGDLLNAMVAYDAFTQIYTNPLLSNNIYNAETLTQQGMAIIEETQSIDHLAKRNGLLADQQISLDFLGDV